MILDQHGNPMGSSPLIVPATPRQVCKYGNYGYDYGYGAKAAAAAGGGASSGFINDDLTTGDNVTEYTNHAGDSWAYGASGATYTRSASFSVGGSIEKADIVPDTDVFECQFVYKGGTDATPKITLWVLADAVNGEEPDNAIGVEVTNAQMQIAFLQSGGQINLDTTVITLSTDDTIKIRVSKNGSNWDVKGYQNDTEICSVVNRAHTGTLADNASIGIESIGGSETVIVADWFGEIIS